LQTDLGGAFAVYNDVNEITSEDLARAESISMPSCSSRAADLRQPRRRVDAGASSACWRWSGAGAGR
jgi:hypothetical protein